MKHWVTTVFASLAVVLSACMGEEPISSDPVGDTLRHVADLHAQVRKQYPVSSIQQYKVITGDLISAGLMPKGFVKKSKATNAWDGRVVIQVFPANAWGAGVPPTINYVIESIPKADCSRLIGMLGQQTDWKVFQINIEPSKKVHTALPIVGDDGCTDGINNIGYTVIAE